MKAGGDGKITDTQLQNLLGMLHDPMATTPGVHPAHWEPPPVEALQKALPQYQVTAFVARGGMGAVYRGVQTALNRPIAIKVLPPRADEGALQFSARFKQEAEAMAALSHPNIVAVFDAGETGDGLLYFVMEFVEGTDVAQLIANQGRVPPGQALDITLGVCDALAFAHEHGIIHRDIKPSNVMIDSRGRVKVADFGLAKLATGESVLVTGSHVAMGTPDFIAPEALVPGAKVDQRADLYAVGVMLYQMLTGMVPRGRFAPPSEMVPGLGRKFDRVVDKAMQTDRTKRFTTGLELRHAVEFLPRPPVSTGSAVRSKAGSRWKRVATVIGVVVVVSLAMMLMKREPQESASASPTATVGNMKAGSTPFVNSLGMKFLPVTITGSPTNGKKVLFSIWETRVQDYEAFAKATHRERQKTPFTQEPTHPAVMVSWEDARAFCAWLTAEEHKSGVLKKGDAYRLPSDHEWSCAVGIGSMEDASQTPEEKSGGLTSEFPWGAGWPPPAGAGNYRGREVTEASASRMQGIMSGFRDSAPLTARVGETTANRFGLYDLGGNAYEWCEDPPAPQRTTRVARGASFTQGDRLEALSSHRIDRAPDYHSPALGFRMVIGKADELKGETVVVTSGPLAGGKSIALTNSLGMKFVPVVVTGGPTDKQTLLFSIWETRVQDYIGFAREKSRAWPKPGFPQGGTHPAVNVTWDDAKAFCEWLTDKEQRAGLLKPGERYRLPSDHEWSCAAGIGGLEDPHLLPAEKDMKLPDLHAWGSKWPPPVNTLNMAGDEVGGLYERHEMNLPDPPVRGYRDDYVFTAPVGSFAPASNGLYDLDGNVCEWCEDWVDSTQKRRVLRGGDWTTARPTTFRISKRHSNIPDPISHCYGFRVVLGEK